jgi:hypothetical protein
MQSNKTAATQKIDRWVESIIRLDGAEHDLRVPQGQQFRGRFTPGMAAANRIGANRACCRQTVGRKKAAREKINDSVARKELGYGRSFSRKTD